MSISSLQQIVDLTSPKLLIVEWAFICRVMYNKTGIEPYNWIANRLSFIMEENPGMGRHAIHNTNVVELLCEAVLYPTS
jgi:hypothetical protein